MKHGGTEIAFIEDPNGFKTELMTSAGAGKPNRPMR